MSREAFQALLAEFWPEISPDKREKIAVFRDLVLAENDLQNLTRLTEPKDFLEGHVLDVKALLEFPGVRFPAMDLGSGGGVPGLLAAICRDDFWILAESEGHKARFLEQAARTLELESRVRVFSGRGEAFLLRESVETVVCRAVGSVERIMGWIGKCSTWNSLVLFKGPKWQEEWLALQKTKWGKTLRVGAEKHYSTPFNHSKRVLIRLDRVPRGTKPS